jgi:SAM-dependent methyltransferase
MENSKYKEDASGPLRIESVTEQLRLLCYAGYTNVLEIGVGAGFLRHCVGFFPQITHTTVDIDSDLSPDYMASVTSLPFGNGQFDLVVCCEVLEHLPFSEFSPALREIRRVARHKVILSLPDRTRHLGVALRFPGLGPGWRVWEWNPPRLKEARKELPAGDEHHWEIGCKGTLPKDVVKKIREAGFQIERQYRLWGHDWHHFFLLGVTRASGAFRHAGIGRHSRH